MKKTKFLSFLAAFALIFAACSNVDGPDGPNGGDGPEGSNGEYLTDGNGTKASPYSVAQVITLDPQSTTEATKMDVWMRGYIVGYYNNETKALETKAPFSKDENFMVAANQNETDMAKCVCVQLPFGKVRDALGLQTTPANLKKEIMVYGDVLKYNTYPGIKNTSAYWFVVENTGIEAPEVGSFDVEEISIADIRAMWEGSAKTITVDKKIVAVVTSDLEGGNSTSKKNAVITALDNSTGLSIRFSDKDHTYKMGEKIEIRVKGTELTQYDNLLQIGNLPFKATRSVGTAEITPKATTIADVVDNYDQYESTVVTVQGTITSENGKWGDKANHQSNILAKDDKELVLFISKYSAFISEDVPTGEVSVTGIIGINKDTKQLIVRNLNDVK